ncbi:MAG: hypothetical protein IKQ48_05875 [Paludibacteraceae bacterium]|nr:hypothetical protein [Paludibacteraceae bacterium]
MKKFLSLFCALAIVLSASAVPVKKARAAKFQRAAVEQLRTQKVKKNAIAVNDRASAAKAGRVAADVKLNAGAPVFRAPKALAAEAIDVKCGSWDVEDWGTDVQVYLYAEDNTVAFVFDVIYGEGNEDLELGKKYTLAEMDSEYSAVFHDGDWHGLVAAEITKTVDEKGLVHFAGSCVDSLDAAFTFHYDEEEFVPTGDTVKHIFMEKAKMKYSENYKDWTITADDGVYAFKLDIFSDNAESPVGNFISDSADFDLSYTEVEVYTAPDSSYLYAAKSAKASIFVENDTTIILAEILAEDGVVYSFAAFYVAPSKQGEATIEATNLVLDDTFFGWVGAVFALANNDDYGVSFLLYPESEDFLAEYTIGGENTGSITLFKQDSTDVEIYSGSIKIEKKEGTLTLSGKVLCYNDIEYTLNLTYVVPDKTRDEAIKVTDGELTIYPEDGDWQVVGLNADMSRYVAIDIVSEAIAGTFTEEDMNANYTYIANVFERNDSLLMSEQYNPLLLNIEVTFDEKDSIATIKGTYRGQGYLDDTDIPEFTLDITAKVKIYAKPAPEPSPYDAKHDFTDVHYSSYDINDDYLADYGVLFVSAQNEKNQYVSLEMWLPDGATELVPGVYEVNVSEQVPSTITATELDLSTGKIYGSFAGILGSQGITELWFIASGKAVVTESGVIELIAKNTQGYRVEARLGEYPEGVENVQGDKVQITKVLRDGQLVILKNGVEYNAQGAVVK